MAVVIPVVTRITTLIPELRKILPQIKFHEVKTPVNDQYFNNSEIIICDFNFLRKSLYNLPKAKWVQGTWAGVDILIPKLEKDKEISYVITRFTGRHLGSLMTEYVVSNIINFERDFFRIRTNQQERKWITDGRITQFRVISELTIGILGLGRIGTAVGKTLQGFGATINALGTKTALPPGEEFSFVSKYFNTKDLFALLKECDYVVNILPSLPTTNNLLDNDALENCKERGTVFINIGRGNVISEQSLVKALTNKWISGAVLDVFGTEPLPDDSPLWTYPQVYITPHIAGYSRAKDIAEHFRDNYLLYQRNLPLLGVFDPHKGY